MFERNLTIIGPEWVRRDVHDIDRMTDECGRSARTGRRADLPAVDCLAIGVRKPWRSCMTQAQSALEKQYRRQQFGIGGIFHRLEMAGQNCAQVGARGKFLLQPAMSLVERFTKLQRECH